MSFCSHFDIGECRSCGWMDLSYAEQLQRKERQLHEALDPFHPEEWKKPVVSPVRGFRNKAKMVASPSPEGIVLGLGESMSLVRCPLYDAEIQNALESVQTWLRELGIKAYDVVRKKGELKHVLLTRSTYKGALMLRFVLRSGGAIPRLQKGLDDLRRRIPALRVISANIQPVHMAILEGEEEIFFSEERQLEERLNGISLYIRPKSFFQTNPEVASKLYKTASEWIGDAKTVWDLFCGVGGFALHCMKEGRSITGIEIEQEAIECARESARSIGKGELTFESLDAATFTTMSQEQPGVVIVNPPRRGLGEAMCRWLSKIAPDTILYSSCNPETLSRDSAYLQEYTLKRVQSFDMFPHTGHYEVLCLFERKFAPSQTQS